ncbi:class I SAM-dependent methyltransferase [Natrarchaeobius sp. A-rgal3]|uniref:class I SAM-dependent methyltransferase n=1 Tax=Natrarchaeobius versutus TaxID=1679078 RepID=UPI0035101246
MTSSPFETCVEEYDEWFEDNASAYRAEQAALETPLPPEFDPHRALEVGVGTGRFADPLGVPLGVDPAREPLERARNRGVEPVRGVAESLPVADDALELVTVVTALSFVDDVDRALVEIRRLLAPEGVLVVAILDRSSPIGRTYHRHKDESPFYADADFLTGNELRNALERAGFAIERQVQTIFEDPTALESDSADQPDVRDGHGEGLFAVVRAVPDRG